MTEAKTPRTLAGLALVLWAATCVAQENPCLTRTVTVSVFNSEDEPAKGLDAAHFRGEVQGRAVDIVSARYGAGSRRVLFLIDTSAATTQDRAKWQSEMAMAEGLVSWLPAEARVALLTFANPKPEKIDFSQPREALNNELVRLEAGSAPRHSVRGSAGTGNERAGLKAGPTVEPAMAPGFSPAIAPALTMLKQPQLGDVICLITDASGNWSAEQNNDIEQKLLAAGVRLFGFLPQTALEQDSKLKIQDSRGPAAIRDLIGATGGDYLIFSESPESATTGTDLTPQDRSKLLIAARSFAQEMSETYILQIKLPEAAEGARQWTLEASAETKKKNSRGRVIYPHKLARCS